MAQEFKTDKTYIVNLNILNSHNAKGWESCNYKFNLGDTGVMAVGDGPMPTHKSLRP